MLVNLLYSLVIFPFVLAFILGFLSYSLVEIDQILSKENN